MNLDEHDPTLVRFTRHMVTILVETNLPSSPRGSASGFVIEYRGKWWLVTAGHFIKGPDSLRDANSRGYRLNVYICDAWKGKDGTGRPNILPRDHLDRWHVIGTDESPPDIALLSLGELLVANLRVGTIEAARESEWNKPPDEFDFYMLAGTPGEMIKERGTTHYPTGYEVVRGLFELEKVERPGAARQTSFERFHGKLVLSDGGHKIASIAGASGGPVFGCTRTAGRHFNHQVIAVQSGWLDKRIITADYLVPHLESALRGR